MPHSTASYEARAEECVRLANLANDDVRADILKLRQSYLHTAQRLRAVGGDTTQNPKLG